MFLKTKLRPKKLNLPLLKNLRFNFSGSNLPNESELKSYVSFFRKNAHKYSKLDPLNLTNKQPTHEFYPDYWEISELEKIENFPIDYTFSEKIAKLDTVLDLSEFLFKSYLSSVLLFFN